MDTFSTGSLCLLLVYSTWLSSRNGRIRHIHS